MCFYFCFLKLLLVADLFAQQVQWEVVIMEEHLVPERFISLFAFFLAMLFQWLKPKQTCATLS